VPCSRSIAADRVVPRERSRLGFAVYELRSCPRRPVVIIRFSGRLRGARTGPV